MRYTKEQISTALALFSTVRSASSVGEILGYPTIQMLYKWCKKYPQYCKKVNVKHYKHASNELRKHVLKRCFIHGESVQSVAQDIGYSSASIYRWARDFHGKGLVCGMSPLDNEHKSCLIRQFTLDKRVYVVG